MAYLQPELVYPAYMIAKEWEIEGYPLSATLGYLGIESMFY
ncbi:hypothetical protein VCHC46B1_1409 [Vibrio cholerae HC-46B1]|nr:hypothetical protein VIF_002019 [Vibrio cholerae TM 11079-80]EGQ99396.1 hypothetical protein VCHE39_2290 [Vibrio cholerae HE39]EGR09042.1 hypothetical protein VCHE48_2378 [Vibrio cholerae HE48]EGS63161.1 hypothetical protein VCHC02A1_1434 [Vibrio cholerae HC-02A1]EJH53892.1 hypothetical protein VCHC43B1_1420 [Vibrio cholerae HC-43B1]EKG71183.1 hypothetical protein VCHC57A1_1339 [Vibrio cholerae HC-57A1]EKK94522.1 hypothetical protein VCHC1A2_2318 [Vibrio cholerae HC-1A2]EKK95706.1 hypothe